MKPSRSMPSLALLVMLSPPASAIDLVKIDRTIAKEPAYQTKAPKYCLLVFGPEAKTRVWLVQDGSVLYVDRNANGDLTEPGEKIEAKKGDNTDPKEGVFEFEAGDIRDGVLTHKGLTLSVMKLDYLAHRDEDVKAYLAKDPQARGYRLSIDGEMPGWKGNGLGGRVEQVVSYRDVQGFLKFADRPGDAPIIYFGGPWHVTLFGRHELKVGRETDMELGVGTPGLGHGTTAWIGFEGVIPENAYPKLEITFPPKNEGGTPLRELFELKQRC